jgi:hypothetical protein
MRRYLHIGLHKTASTYLQREVFPYLENINYYGGGDIATFHRNGCSSSGFSLAALWSTEAALGWPYPQPEKPRIDALMSICNDMDISDVIVVKRDFPEWVKSLWFQTLNEGGTLGLDDWWKANREQLEDWRRIFRVLEGSCFRAGISLTVIQFSDLLEDKALFVGQLENVLQTKISKSILPVAKINVSLYGVNVLRIYLLLNRINRYLIRSSTLRSAMGRFGVSPRALIQRGLLGRLLDRISSRTVSLPMDLQQLDWT